MEDTREVLTVDYQPKLETRDRLIQKGFTDDTINKEVQNFIDCFIETPARCSDMDALFMIWMRKVQFVNELRLERELEKQKG